MARGSTAPQPTNGGEGSVRFRTRLHPVSFTGGLGVAAFVTLATTLIIRNNELPPSTELRVGVVGAALALSALIPSWIRWRTGEFSVDGQQLRLQIRFLRWHRMELPLREVAAIEVSQSWLGRQLDYGTVHVAGPDGVVDSFAPVAHPTGLRDGVAAALPGRRTR